jgi:hypothetical protein
LRAVIAAINATGETVRISASKIHINGDVTFESGYDPNGRVAVGGSADDVNAGATTISGGKITTGSITAGKLEADLAIASTMHSPGATAIDTGTGWYITAAGNTSFRIGNPSGSRVKWDGGDLYIYGAGYNLHPTDGLFFYDASGEGDTPRMIRWQSGPQIAGNNLRLWLYGPGDFHYNIYNSYSEWFHGETGIMRLDDTEGLRLKVGNLCVDSPGRIYFVPADTTDDHCPLVVNNANQEVLRKTNGVSDSLTVVTGVNYDGDGHVTSVDTATVAVQGGIVTQLS